MEFFIIISGNKNDPILCKISNEEVGITVKMVLDKYSQQICLQKDSINLESAYIYIDNLTDPLSCESLIKLDDLNVSLSSLGSSQFDIIISDTPLAISPLHFIDKPLPIMQERQLYEEMIENGRLYESTYPSKSFDYYQKASQLLPENPEPLCLQVDLLFQYHIDNLAYIKTALGYDHFPKNYQCQLNCARFKLRYSQWKDAINILKKLMVSDPSNIQKTTYYLSKAYLASKDEKQAFYYIEQNYENNHDDLKSAAAYARLLGRRGDIAKASRICLHNFSINFDHKATKRALCDFILNKRSAIILHGELGDGIKNPNTLFYFGHILSEGGSLEAASFFYKCAITISPNVSAMYLGLFDNEYHRSGFSFSLNEISTSFLNNLKNCIPSTSPLIIFDSIDIFSKKDKTEYQPINPFKPIQFGTTDPSFSFEEIDTCAILIRFALSLFLGGYFDESEQLVHNLLQIFLPFRINASIIVDDITIFVLLYQIIPSLPRPLPKLQESPPIYLIGDTHIFPIAHRQLTINDQPRRMIPYYLDFPHFTNWNPQKPSEQLIAFNNIVKSLPPNSTVLFLFSDLNCSHVSFTSLSSQERIPIQTPAERIIDFICSLLAYGSHFGHTMLLHPLTPGKEDSIQFVIQFNSEIEKNILSLKISNGNIKMLNLFDKLTITENENEKVINPSFLFDDVHFDPINSPYLQLLEQSISEAIR